MIHIKDQWMWSPATPPGAVTVFISTSEHYTFCGYILHGSNNWINRTVVFFPLTGTLYFWVYIIFYCCCNTSMMYVACGLCNTAKPGIIHPSFAHLIFPTWRYNFRFCFFLSSSPIFNVTQNPVSVLCGVRYSSQCHIIHKFDCHLIYCFIWVIYKDIKQQRALGIPFGTHFSHPAGLQLPQSYLPFSIKSPVAFFVSHARCMRNIWDQRPIQPVASSLSFPTPCLVPISPSLIPSWWCHSALMTPSVLLVVHFQYSSFSSWTIAFNKNEWLIHTQTHAYICAPSSFFLFGVSSSFVICRMLCLSLSFITKRISWQG